MIKIPSSEITPEHVYLNRRAFLKSMGIVTAGAVALAACAPSEPATEEASSIDSAASTIGQSPDPADETTLQASAATDELGDPLNTYKEITNFNNFYEFSLDKEDVAKASRDFKTSPWTVEVSGLVNNPQTFDIDDLRTMFDQEERIYRLRCVEAWSMVIPWMGFPIHKLLEVVQPKAEAKYVRFETLHDPEQFPEQNYNRFEWPYVEGLRLDEAMNDLAILATGLYGKELLPQNGAPIRLVVPWKYGFKSIKSIVRIVLSEGQPSSFWMQTAPTEYGFYANVNPDVPHPRWTQSSERRIGELGRRPTLKFNGYEEEVAALYAGMDLAENF
ncbi:MAG TPA: protein-methionine-sulfoxide reductase catalytic subunit MsrP [Anaerolineales bacterium]|nr:protein-methionine-sulfoxide reductase catalytic subunit MsrP [Anaerolineales bacterium]